VRALDFVEFIKRTIMSLNCSQVEYVIVGGILVSVYGEPRATKNIDVVLDISPENREAIEQLLECLEKMEFHIPGGISTIINALKSQSHFSIFNKTYLYWIDARGVYSQLDRLALETRIRKKIFGLDTWIESIECLIVAKLSVYYSEQSLKDVISILQTSRELIDESKLRSLARKVGILDRLEKILRQEKK